ncbi:MAG: DUF86 domain-containing protein [Bacteroidota bacterium]|nr:DUF86 domain-containing protein [Bacteroidota bacterium]
MSKRITHLLLEDILDAANKILKYTEGLTYEDFYNDNKSIDAVCRNFEIIGEAANQLPDDFREQNDSIDWFRIRGFRNRIIHEYFGVDIQILWNIKENQIPELIREISKITGQ